MKTTIIRFFLISTFGCLLMASCKIEEPQIPTPSLEPTIAKDFNYRYPNVDIIKTSSYSTDRTDIIFTDGDGFTSTAVYLGDDWMITEKQISIDNYMSLLPRRIIAAYLGTGIENEVFIGDDNYIIEISRRGIRTKQYEFKCHAPYSYGHQVIDNLVYDIVIDEEGTLLTCSHHDYNRSINFPDISESLTCVQGKYRTAAILGAVNDGGKIVVYIRDNGIVKTVTTHDDGRGFRWENTCFPLNILTALPASVISDKEAFETSHPNQPFYALSTMECPDGIFYGLTFGNELNNTTIYSKAE